MSDDKDAEDGSDWLSSQFDATAALPAQPPAVTQPPAAMPPAVVPSPPAPAAAPLLPAPAAPTPPLASAPPPNTGGGFNWGLKPGGAADQPAAVPPPVPAPTSLPVFGQPTAAPPPLVSPPLASSPTQPYAAPPTQPYAPAPTQPYAAPPTQPYAPAPTQPLSWDEFASTQHQSAPPPTPDAPLEQPTEAYTVQPWQPAAATSPSVPQHPGQPVDPTSAIDSLFGDHKFQDYDDVGVLATIQVPPSSAVDDSSVLREPREPLPRSQKVLLSIAGGLIAALILVGLYFFGQHLGAAAAVQPTSTSTAAASGTPTPAGTGGPAAAGVQQWTALQGGECIQPFTSAWALSFTVVACTADHDAQMVFKGKLPDDSNTKYPGAAGFQKEIAPLCSAASAINYSAAVSVTDLQVSFSYPPTSASWISGDRTYYCFINRVSGGNLPGDLSVAKAP